MKVALQSSRKEGVFSVDDTKSVEYACPGKETWPHLTPYPRIISRWLAEVHVKGETIKIEKKAKGEYLHDLGKILKQDTKSTLAKKENINKLDSIKIGDCCSLNDTIKITVVYSTYQERYL